MTDKSSIQQVLGCLLQRPQLLGEVDKYNLSIADFSTRFERYIFFAISGLHAQGAKSIEPIDIVNFLENDAAAKQTFELNNGVEYLQDIADFSSVENFDYYYNKLKKLNLLRDLKKQGFDISEFICDDLTNPKSQEINREFENLSVTDICAAVRKKLLGLEATYAKSGEIETENALDGMRELISEMGERISVGAPVQGSIYSKVISGAEPGALTIRAGSSGIGKALPNSTRIPTPTGWKTVKEIQPGDYLFDAFGKPTKVLAVFPQGKKEVWQVSFESGRTARCCNEHLWSYYEASHEKKMCTKTLKEIFMEGEQTNYKKFGKYCYRIPIVRPVQLPEKTYSVDPYVMGLMLGSGSFRQGSSNKSLILVSEDEQLPNIIAKQMGVLVKRHSANEYCWYFEYPNLAEREHTDVWVEEILQQHPELWNCDSHTKFIPDDYLFGSKTQRLELLRGLMDIGGDFTPENGRVSFTTVSARLKTDFMGLLSSLGILYHLYVEHKPDGRIAYHIDLIMPNHKKKEIFHLERKRKQVESYLLSYPSAQRQDFETDSIIKIEKLDYQEEMTCFLVDNAEHLFVAGDTWWVTHNTRTSLADALYLAYPIRYNSARGQWEQRGSNERVLYIMTEQTFPQIRKMILAYLTDINESRFKMGHFSKDESARLDKAIEIMEHYKDNLTLVKMPNPTIETLKTTMRENCLMKDIGYVFFDYIQINPALLNEFKGAQLRNDELLLLMSTALKDLAVELNVAVFTSTQVNANADDNKNIRNEASLAGGRATINKADNGAIMARPTREELEVLQPITSKYGVPNLVTDIFKVRSGEWTQVRIWSIMNLGTLKRKDLFITDAQLGEVVDFDQGDEFEVHTWSDTEYQDILDYVRKLNEKNGLPSNS